MNDSSEETEENSSTVCRCVRLVMTPEKLRVKPEVEFKDSSRPAIREEVWPTGNREPAAQPALPAAPRETLRRRPDRCSKEFFHHVPAQCRNRCSVPARFPSQSAWWCRTDRKPGAAP